MESSVRITAQDKKAFSQFKRHSTAGRLSTNARVGVRGSCMSPPSFLYHVSSEIKIRAD